MRRLSSLLPRVLTWAALAASFPRLLPAQGVLLPSPAPIQVANAELRVLLDPSTGGILQVTNLAGGIDFLQGHGTPEPWRIELEGRPEPRPTKCLYSFRQDSRGRHIDFLWTTDVPGLSVKAEVSASTDGTVAFQSGILSSPGVPRIEYFEYPIFSGIGNLGASGPKVTLVHPAAMGYAIRDPVKNAPGLPLHHPYPEAFYGCALQCWSYTARSKGGFSLEVHDPLGTAKAFPWTSRKDGLLETRVRWFPWDAGRGKGMDLTGIPVVIRANRGGGWEEAAAAYRSWAARRPWCGRGPLWKRRSGDRIRWLEDTGLATLGISLRDPAQERLFALYRTYTGLHVFHVGGFWWPGGKPGVEWYGGYLGWFNSRLRKQNLAAASRDGDHAALWIFDLSFSTTAPSWGQKILGDPLSPWKAWAVSPFFPPSGAWRFLCPVTKAWRDLHGWREMLLQALYDPDAFYFDIGPCVAPLGCENTSHGHPKGKGRWMVQALRRMLEGGRDWGAKIHGSPVAHGTELMSEVFLDLFDFYYARAGGGPLGMLEMEPFRKGILAGWARKVPLFTFVYHEYGPVRLDGNLKLARELGELFYWTSGRVFIWGGIPLLDMSLSAAATPVPACPPGGPCPPWRVSYETFSFPYQVYDDRPYGLDEGRALYLGRLGRMRTGPAKDYLVFGRMRRTPPHRDTPGLVRMDYSLYNTFLRKTKYARNGRELGPEFAERGQFTVPSVLVSAWTAPKGRLGILLLNISACPASTNLEIDPEFYLGSPGPWKWRLLDLEGIEASGELEGKTGLKLTLPSRDPRLLEIGAL